MPTSKNGTTPPSPAVIEAVARVLEAPTVPDDAPPVGQVIGLAGAPLTLAGEEFHWKRFTAAGFRTLQAFVQAPDTQLYAVPAGEDATIGEMIAEAFVVLEEQGAGRRLSGFFRYTVHEPLPDDLFDRCQPDEIAVAIDSFFNQSGMRFMGRLLKNDLTLQLEKQMEKLKSTQNTTPTGTPASASTS